MVYPRACGGTCKSAWSSNVVMGLSPRLRGNRTFAAAAASLWGSIPALAGEPLPPLHHRPPDPVYPRACGGTNRIIAANCARSGLSPRLRGNLLLLPRYGLATGSIPALAGEPVAVDATSPLAEVYPRACGGTRTRYRSAAVQQGLSPRLRGNHLSADSTATGPRSIPALAGEPIVTASIRQTGAVYPRACGGTINGPG